MTLYEINEEIRRIVWTLEPDPDTGEIPLNCAELEERLRALNMDRGEVLRYLAKLALNIRAEASALKAEESRLYERRKNLEQREKSVLSVLDRECGHQTTNLGVATLSYRRTEYVKATDEAKVIRWLKRHKYGDCIRARDPEVDKNGVKALIKSGTVIPGVTLVDGVSYNLK